MKIIFLLILMFLPLYSSWSTNRICISEYNCTCSEDTKTINCNHLQITKIPPDFEIPSDITTLTFKNNEIDKLNENFAKGSNLRELDLSHNEIAFISINAFKYFSNLNRLDLSHNRIWTIGSNIFQGMNQLQKLDLSYNNIESFFSNVFQENTQLKELFLNFNPLMYLDHKMFSYLPNLEQLNLQYTGLLSLPDDVFTYTPHLKYLSLANNAFTKVPTDALSPLKMLRALELSDNPIVLIEANAFRNLTNLTTLYLNQMAKLEKIKNYSFQNLISLRILHCSYNFQLKEIHPLAFSSNSSYALKNLEMVFFRFNALPTISEKLLNWKQLRKLDIVGNPWLCDCRIRWMADIHWRHDLEYNIRCENPPHLAGKLISSVRKSDFQCETHLSAQVVITLTLITVAAIIFSLTGITIFLNRRGWCTVCRSKMQAKYHQVSQKREDDIEYEPKE